MTTMDTQPTPLPLAMRLLLEQVRDRTGMPIDVQRMTGGPTLPANWEHGERYMLVLPRNGELIQLGPMDLESAWWTLYGFMWGSSVTAVDLRDE